MNKFLAEMFGTAMLVLLGCGAVTIGGLGPVLGAGQPLAPLATISIGFAFGITVMAMAYGIGPISGCHINPAVTLGVWASGRMPTAEVAGYIVSQLIGAVIGAGILLILLTGKGGGYDLATGGLGQNGWGEGYLGAYRTLSAMIAEFIATFVFLVAILGVTQKTGGQPATAGLAIGLTLMLLHLPFINITGLSVNPARSLGPAVFVGSKALAQVWLFLIVPSIAGLCAGFVFKAKVFEA
jgi:aquaporin Z